MNHSATDRPIKPGSTIGIIGGGQLGRMTAVAAAELGYRVHVFTPEADSPATHVSTQVTTAAYDDQDAVEAFGQSVDVVTFEFENVPAETVRHLSQLVPVRPHWECLAVCQDRVLEKTFCRGSGIQTAPWQAVENAAELADAIAVIGAPAVLKTTRLGYDGKGQVRIHPGTDPTAAWHDLSGGAASLPAILEGFVDFRMEVSVITARRPDGTMASFDVVENRHKNGVLDVTIAPAQISEILTKQALEIGQKLTAAMDLVGLLAVELFITHDDQVLVNEMAPRPHNSGHWTQDGCKTSQFEQLVRAVANLPLGTTERHSDAVMHNLLGGDALDWPRHLGDPDNKLHLYGKGDPRPGRKMGHINTLYAKGSQPQG